ncbi:hypothetical protein EIN_504870 [Entamoeba invadens IP1]|uniref:Vacuolar protein sorting-associated protein 13 DH-like domain-containing protein n=1 Tax=Entamoeba invadens IP1 TaxID=370355 RepID=A0A0A1U7D2_ENTIV|nr:hypothetical protein EIN_504870 [Entamoeba invadens IP1]ELP90301.1 hypothetical protein EIN_504870 [Entamoeba invadens IP1]|eukprot:XP_004257072.1 hypothetical protein EIN_504870 [Entamoeba invadens IP1]
MTQRIRVKIKTKGISLTLNSARITLMTFSYEYSNVSQTTRLSVDSLKLTDLNNCSECVTSGDNTKCLDVTYSHKKNSTCEIFCNSLTLQLVPEFLNSVISSFEPTLTRLFAIQRDATTHTTSLSLEKSAEFATPVDAPLDAKNYNFRCENSSLVFKNYSGNKLRLSANFEGILNVQNQKVDSLAVLVKDTLLTSEMNGRDQMMDIALIKLMSVSLNFKRSALAANFALSDAQGRVSNRDIENTLKLFTELHACIQKFQVFHTNTSQAVLKKVEVPKSVQKGLEIQEQPIRKTPSTHSKWTLPDMKVALSMRDMRLTLFSEEVSSKGKSIETTPCFFLTSQSIEGEIENTTMTCKILQSSLEYVNTTHQVWIKEPLIEPFNVFFNGEFPYCALDISPDNFLVINITPEVVSVANDIVKSWSQSLNSEFYNNKGKCTIHNSSGDRVRLFYKEQEVVVLNGEAKEISMIHERCVQLQIGNYDVISIENISEGRTLKKAFIVTHDNRSVGCVIVKMKAFNKYQRVKICAPVIFVNTTHASLRVWWGTQFLNLEKNKRSGFDVKMGMARFEFVVENKNKKAKYSQDFTLLSSEKQCGYTVTQPLQLNNFFMIEFKGQEGLKCGNEYITPLVVQFKPPFTVINRTPLEIKITCFKYQNEIEKRVMNERENRKSTKDIKKPVNGANLHPKKSNVGIEDKNKRNRTVPRKIATFKAPNKPLPTRPISQNQSILVKNSDSYRFSDTSFLTKTSFDPRYSESEVLTIHAFSRGSLTISPPDDEICYFIEVLSCDPNFSFFESEKKSEILHFSSSMTQLPPLLIGKHFFRQSHENNKIILESPFYLKNSSETPKVVKYEGRVDKDDTWRVFAPDPKLFDEKITFLDRVIGLEKVGQSNERNVFSLKESQNVTIDGEEIFLKVSAFYEQNFEKKSEEKNEEMTNAKCLEIKPRFLLKNETNEVIVLNGNVIVKEKSQKCLHFKAAYIALHNFYEKSVPKQTKILFDKVDEFQIILYTYCGNQIFSIKTIEESGTFITTFYGCEKAFLRIENLTTFEVDFKQVGSKTIFKSRGQTNIPFGWADPTERRELEICGVLVDPLKLESYYKTTINNSIVYVYVEAGEDSTHIVIGAEEKSAEEIQLTLSVLLPTLNISLFRKAAVEELSLTITGIKSEVVKLDKHVGFEFQFDYIQLDFQRFDITQSPVIISPRPLEWIYDTHQTFFHFGILLTIPNLSAISKVLYVSHLTFTLRPLEVLIEMDVLNDLVQTYNEYSPLIIFEGENKRTYKDTRVVIENAVINSIDINMTIHRGNSTFSDHSNILQIVSSIARMDVDRIPIYIAKTVHKSVYLSKSTLLARVAEKLFCDLEDMKWTFVTRLLGFRAVGTNYDNIESTDEFHLSAMNELPSDVRHEIACFFSRENNMSSFSDPSETVKEKIIPSELVEAQRSTFEYSVLDGAKNLGTSVVRSVKGLWNTSVGLTDIVGAKRKTLAPAGFMGGIVVGAAGIVVKPIDGIVGFFKSVSDGLNGLSFGQIATQRMRPPRYCPGQVIQFNLYNSFGWSLLNEVEGGYFKEDGYKTWLKKVDGNRLYAILFTQIEMIGVDKKSPLDPPNFLWRILYEKIYDFGLEGTHICVYINNPFKSGFFFGRTDKFVLENWDKEHLTTIKETIQEITGKVVRSV